jgi:hypothetical protein
LHPYASKSTFRTGIQAYSVIYGLVKWRDGLLDDELWSGWRELSLNFFSTAGGKAFWEDRSYMFGSGFREFVDQEIMTSNPNPKAKPWGAYSIDG